MTGGQEGVAVEYVTRARAIKKLQLSLSDFRRLCILKGIYPRDPKHKNKIGSTATNKKTVYLLKDIQFLSHEPLLQKFRELKSFHRRIRKYMGKGEWAKIKSLEKNTKPVIKLDHLVRERYPSFVDALRDLDDPLSMLALFATLPRTNVDSHQADTSLKCAKLLREFESYVVATDSLKKAFISIKGIYYQAEILGQQVTWVVPHEFTTPVPVDVDFKVMLTFLEFYMTLMRFVNYRLFTRLGWEYPSQFIEEGQEVVFSSSFPEISLPDEIFPDGDHRLLSGKKIFVSREVPRKALCFVLQCLGATASFSQEDGTCPIQEDDPSLTHQIVDRPFLSKMFVEREYLQPQWVFDSLNTASLVDMTDYRLGATLPPHLSPFTSTEEDDLTDESEDETAEAVTADAPIVTKPAKKKKMQKVQKELAVSMLSKKRQKLYQKMQHSRQKRLDEKNNLKSKREAAATKVESQ
ncbi:Pescadillo-like protein [Paramicrosporidium saccamoebae]|uniref:Pescadillo homolog n=1 Tax=Paramicrosporidium saccamoebae TaxID=1246581 RepID=A0A2H9TP56_9FUNG|nr:Pescadillo-like protein [Paramicrosporidium saccamoebae]